MNQTPRFSRTCASALLDAYGRNDAHRMREIACEVSALGPHYAADYAESERLEMLAGIAHAMWRSSLRDGSRDPGPCLRLLYHFSNPGWNDSGFTPRD